MSLLRRIMKNGLTATGLLVITLLILVAAGADFLAPHDHNAIDALRILEGPSADHWLGTDGLGRDVLSRMIFGARVSLLVGFVSAGLACSIGVVLGAVSGYFGGWVDSIIMRLVDVMLCFPSFFFPCWVW